MNFRAMSRSLSTVLGVLAWTLSMTVASGEATAQPRSGPVGRVGVGDSTLLAGMVQVEYAAQWPGGDLADRYRFHNAVGIRIEVKNRHNWLIGGAARFLFGTRITGSDPLAGIRGPDGFLIGTDGFQYLPAPNLRGWQFGLDVGKVTGLGAVNPNSGLTVSAGLGYVQHRTWWDVERDFLPQLEGEYAKLYDRFASGPYLRQTIGYLLCGEKRFINVRGGVEFVQGFTRDRRDFQADLGGGGGGRLDLQVGVFAAWILPIYENPKTQFFYD